VSEKQGKTLPHSVVRGPASMVMAPIADTTNPSLVTQGRARLGSSSKRLNQSFGAGPCRMRTFGTLGVAGALLGIVLATILLTELITNNAAAVLVFPVAIAAAAAMGLDPRPVAIAVAIAASASFLTPIGYQTNTMVYGPGGYRFTDYGRLGAPLTVIVVTTVVVLASLGAG
jgi:hypothetical protein